MMTDTELALLKRLVQALVDHPREVTLVQDAGLHSSLVTISTVKHEVGRVIGKNGQLIQALRELFSVVAEGDGPIHIEVEDREHRPEASTPVEHLSFDAAEDLLRDTVKHGLSRICTASPQLHRPPHFTIRTNGALLVELDMHNCHGPIQTLFKSIFSLVGRRRVYIHDMNHASTCKGQPRFEFL